MQFSNDKLKAGHPPRNRELHPITSMIHNSFYIASTWCVTVTSMTRPNLDKAGKYIYLLPVNKIVLIFKVYWTIHIIRNNHEMFNI